MNDQYKYSEPTPVNDQKAAARVNMSPQGGGFFMTATDVPHDDRK